MRPALLSLLLATACTGPGGTLEDAGGVIHDAGAEPDGGVPDAGEQPDAGHDGGTNIGTDAGTDAGFDAGTPDAGPCTETYNVPPVGLPGWSAALSKSGANTLTWDANHSHNDGAGPLGFCPAPVQPGKRYLALVSARFETDQSPPSAGCVVDYLANDPTFAQYGMCFSGGNRHIYVEVRDEAGKRIAAGFDVFFAGNTVPISDQGKPANEFPMNFPINGGGNRYGARARYTHPTDGPLPSDAVTNMRLPGNHHVNYLLTFQVKVK